MRRGDTLAVPIRRPATFCKDAPLQLGKLMCAKPFSSHLMESSKDVDFASELAGLDGKHLTAKGL